MTRYSYLDYAQEAEDNQTPGSALVTRAPEGWSGARVNGFVAAHASATRNLGDKTLFAPVDNNDEVISQQAGTMALQDANDAVIGSGVLGPGVRGAVPVGTVIMFGESLATYNSRFTALYEQGWIICDGRTITHKITGASVVMPNWIGRFPFISASGSLATGGSSMADTSNDGTHNHTVALVPDGAHAHGSETVGHVLTRPELPVKIASLRKTGDEQEILGTVEGPATAHTHGITSVGNHDHSGSSVGNNGLHSHTVPIVPSFIGLIFLKRMW